jgi:hypothetical protein
MLPNSGVKALPKKLLPLILFGIAVTSLFSVQPAEAYSVTLQQVGSNVVATGSGAIDLTGLTLLATGSEAGVIMPSTGTIVTGPFSDVSRYVGTFTGPTNFGSGGDTTLANSGSGDIVGFSFNQSLQQLVVPLGYASGGPLSDSSTYNNATFNSLGVTPGTYVWTWGAGANQNFTLQLGAVPDAGSTLPLLGSALLAVATLRRKLSR